MAWANIFLFSLFLSLHLHHSDTQNWIKAGYWYAGSESPIPDINSALFTHLICGFANVNSSTYQLSIPLADEQYFSIFTATVKRKNPSVVTLLSIWDGLAATAQSILGNKVNTSVLSSMLNQSSHRKTFIESSIKTARQYGFQGIDLCWVWPNMASDMTNMGVLLDEWRAEVNSESRNSSQAQLILTMALHYLPTFEFGFYPIDSIQRNMDWAQVVAYDYHLPTKENSTHAHAALYDPSSHINTDYGITEWLAKGFPPKKLLLGLPYHGYAWTLLNPKENAIGAPSSGLAVTQDGSMSYKYIKGYIRSYGATTMFNATYVVNYCIIGSTWITFDDVETIRTKIAYAKGKKLLGYYVFAVANDDNWVLSQAAQEDRNIQQPKWRLLVIILTTTATVILVLGFVIYYARRRIRNSKGIVGTSKEAESKLVNRMAAAGDFNSNAPNLQVFSLAEIEAATDKLSIENKLGEGGYGPVYKGVLPNGQEIAVKKLKQASKQGFEEFRNEVMLTAKLQHTLSDGTFWTGKNALTSLKGLLKGFYISKNTQMTIIHRDLKPSNILLDGEMKPKISDFGMARIFTKDEHEANTGRIVGTYGYVPPEYIRKGVYSSKSDIYSFGILLLQIIGGKRNACYYGPDENLNLLEYAYELWKEGKGMDFMDPSLDDTLYSFKLIRCLQIALLCIQEDANDRPSMLEISSMLKNESAALFVPKQPAFSTRRDEDEENIFPLRLEIYSLNEATISEMEAR
ncbi:hypothetical protein CJ030_MR5G010023 [Morella rubra]|uniref:non-specific serine/threonine protein kinase n=1 Tax=Morella rubra TaxID=262757 RepID=A0A6A1VIZ1_9ROSI|nr:hypothetical protein CJ030_MR5G010023 [Morella rubra]